MSDVIKGLMPLSPAVCIPYDARRGSMLGNEFDPDHIPEKIVSPDGWELSGDYVRFARLINVDEPAKCYKGPVLIVHGTDDEAVAYSFGAELKDKYENAVLVPVEKADHCFNGHFEELKQAVRDFLGRL